MFSTVLKEITGYFDRRFIFVFLFPSLIFWGALLAVYSLNGDSDTLYRQWSSQSSISIGIQVIGALTLIVFFAFVLSNQLIWLTRQFEGYWEWIPFGLGGLVLRLRRAHYQGILSHLNSQDDQGYEKIYERFTLPDEMDEVMPTRLGNILKSAELYPLQRYNLDGVLLWPRLYTVLPETFVKSLADAKTSLDFMLIISTLSAGFGLISSAYLLITGGVWWLFLICFIGGIFVAYLSYYSATEAAIPYAQLIKSAFDMYRWDLLDKLGYRQPSSFDDETTLWDNVCKHIYRGHPQDEHALPYKATDDDSQKLLSLE